jgi:hypothetical protein
LPRADVTEVARPASNHAVTVATIIGGVAGLWIGRGLSGNCDGPGSCRVQATAGFAALGAGTGAIVGMAARAWRAGGRVVYRR